MSSTRSTTSESARCPNPSPNQAWLGGLIRRDGGDLFRMKGLLAIYLLLTTYYLLLTTYYLLLTTYYVPHDGGDLFRMKGVLAIAHAKQRFVYHAVSSK